MRSMLVVLLLSMSMAAHAQFKCVGADGAVSFQQMPCSAQHKGQALQLRDSRPPAEPAGVASDAGTVGKRKLSDVEISVQRMERERRVREIDREIEGLEQDLAWRPGAIDREVAELRQRQQSAANNLAGATWHQSLATEMVAVTQKHKAAMERATERIKVLRADRAAILATK